MQERKRVMLWISKFALTKGVFEQECELCDGESAGDLVRPVIDGFASCNAFYWMDRDCHLTRDNAVRKANDMRERKLKSLRKQMLKIGAMSFDVDTMT